MPKPLDTFTVIKISVSHSFALSCQQWAVKRTLPKSELGGSVERHAPIPLIEKLMSILALKQNQLSAPAEHAPPGKGELKKMKLATERGQFA